LETQNGFFYAIIYLGNGSLCTSNSELAL
jgi:hypothetical protein